MLDSASTVLVWGCDPQRQLELGWLSALLGPLSTLEAWESPLRLADDPPQAVVLVESGLLRLERSPDPERLLLQHQERQERLQALAGVRSLGLIHLSDEEGLDGDAFYPALPAQTVIWRNFAYARFAGARVFPIGPRADFLEPEWCAQALLPASQRPFPWGFMGTLWSSGSRSLATSLFLRALPEGFFFGGRSFGQGLPPDLYRQQLSHSAFALCPEGDRHLDTFRLYESLQAGCIPLLVDQRAMAASLLGDLAPWPVFHTWPEALHWAQDLLGDPAHLDATQAAITAWWRSRRACLTIAMRHTLQLPSA